MLLHFMARVLQHKKNGLEFDNLVVIFGPALLRPSVQQTPEEALKTMPEITNIVKFLVSYRNQLVFTVHLAHNLTFLKFSSTLQENASSN